MRIGTGRHHGSGLRGAEPGRRTPSTPPAASPCAPENSAFAKIPASTLKKVLASKAKLTKILTYHVAGGKVTTSQFSAGDSIKTLEGGKVTLARVGATCTVNGAKVACADVHTANATVCVINGVLMPRS